MKFNIQKVKKLHNIADIFFGRDIVGHNIVEKYCEGIIIDINKPDYIIMDRETHKIMSKSHLCNIMSFNFIITKLVWKNIIKKID